eukprot:SAG11_NODE_2296_length_3554_cov_3.189870_2_plen_56_part_00
MMKSRLCRCRCVAVPFARHRTRAIPAFIILHLKLSTFSVLKLVLKVYLSKLRYFL